MLYDCPIEQDKIRFIKWNHIDGPMVCYESGAVRWLTLKERFLCWIGYWKQEDLK
jgi:hypothetical protein